MLCCHLKLQPDCSYWSGKKSQDLQSGIFDHQKSLQLHMPRCCLTIIGVHISTQGCSELALKGQIKETYQRTEGRERNRIGQSYYMGFSIPNTHGFWTLCSNQTQAVKPRSAPTV